MNEVFCRIIKLPPNIHGFVMEDPDGNYNIYLNAADPESRQRLTFLHEFTHVERGHLRDLRPVSELEAEVAALERCNFNDIA